MSHSKKVELLSPAGNIDGFYGAIHAGADAVYLAGNRFGARAYAENFTTKELVRCIRYAHLLGRKVYLTVNTLLKESEFTELYDYLRPFCEEGLDAVIVQDMGVLRFIREHFPDCGLHASTQMTLCGSWGASLLKNMGVSRIVPARELSLQELVSIKQHTGLEIEAFVHGAMCYCYSGQCLFSSILGGRSGNRGRCAQPCRLPYAVVGDHVKTGECYPLSLKDMCTIEHIPRLIEAGIDSFKIEGRMKKPEYTAGVTECYRRYVDRYYELREQRGAAGATQVYHVEKKELKRLNCLYIRSGIQDGYYFKRNGRDMVTLESPAYNGSDEALLTEIHAQYIAFPLKLPVCMKAVFHTGQKAELMLRHGKNSAAVTGEIVEKAIKQPVTKENIRKQLDRLGESIFYADEIEISVSADCFYPLKQINELRRSAVAKLEEQILLERGYGKKICHQEETAQLCQSHPNHCDYGNCAISVRTVPQLEAVVEQFCSEKLCIGKAKTLTEMSLRLYVDGDLLLWEWEEVSALCSRLAPRAEIFAALPYILRESDREYLETLYGKVKESSLFHGFLVRSMDGLGFVREKDKNIPCRADAGLYIWNQAAVKELGVMLEGFCLPYELKTSEQKMLLERMPCEKIIYGRIPMMITANCVLKTTDECRCRKAEPEKMIYEHRHSVVSQGHVALKDRFGKEFPVLINCDHCMNIIYNCVPLSAHNDLPRWIGRADLRMDFTLESAIEVKQILTSLSVGTPFVRGEYTTGHEKRGVE